MKKISFLLLTFFFTVLINSCDDSNTNNIDDNKYDNGNSDNDSTDFSYLDDYLIAYWSFDDQTTNDFSQNEYHAIPRNEYYYDQGKKGYGIRFIGVPGNSLNGGYLQLPNIDLESEDEFSISLWVYHTNTSDQGDYYLFMGDFTNGYLGIGYNVNRPNNSGELYHIWSVGAKQANNNFQISPIVHPRTEGEFFNSWNHYAIVFKDGVMKAYYNNLLMGEKQQDVLIYGNFAALNATFWSGSSMGNTSRNSAIYDEVKIYNHALSQCEIDHLNGIECD